MKFKDFKKQYPGIRKGKVYNPEQHPVEQTTGTTITPEIADVKINKKGFKEAKPAAISRSWCWTLNNYTSKELEAIANHPFRFLIYGKEIGESGTPHLQGYLEIDQPMRLSAVKKIPGFERTHLETRRGTRDEARDYCMKDGDITESGDWSAGGQGKRTDWKQMLQFVKANPDFGKIIDEYPGECIMYTNGIKAVINELKKEQGREALAHEFGTLPLYQWEDKLLKDLNGKPHDRKVTWIVDKKGGRGKTTFAKYLIGNHNAAYFCNGKSTDIAHNYHGERIAIFDYCRSNEERTNYQIIESIKNGLIFSPKYDSTTKVCAIPHVVCFSNFAPDLSMLSADRWDIRELTDASCEIVSPSSDTTETAIAVSNTDDESVATSCVLQVTHEDWKRPLKTEDKPGLKRESSTTVVTDISTEAHTALVTVCTPQATFGLNHTAACVVSYVKTGKDINYAGLKPLDILPCDDTNVEGNTNLDIVTPINYEDDFMLAI